MSNAVWKSYLNPWSPRYEAWRAILESDEVPVRDPVPYLSRLGQIEEDFVHPLDIAALTADQRTRLVNFIVERFDQERSTVERELDQQGFAIRAEDLMFAYNVYALPIKAELVFDKGTYEHAVRCGAAALQWITHTGLAIHPEIKGTVGRPHHRLCPSEQRIVPAYLLGVGGWNLTVTIEIQSLEMCEYVRTLLLPECSRLVFVEPTAETPEKEVEDDRTRTLSVAN